MTTVFIGANNSVPSVVVLYDSTVQTPSLSFNHTTYALTLTHCHPALETIEPNCRQLSDDDNLSTLQSIYTRVTFCQNNLAFSNNPTTIQHLTWNPSKLSGEISPFDQAISKVLNIAVKQDNVFLPYLSQFF